MSEPKCFGKYVLLSQMEAKIVTRTPLRVGKGKELSVVESDLPIMKNSENVPIIPGSSLKGFFRANSERIIANINKEEAEQLIRKIFGSSEKKESGSAILFYDLKAKEHNYKLENRKHIKIDPETGGVDNLFEAECVMDGSVFEGLIATTRNLSPAFMGIVQPVIELSSLGISRLGGFKSRGYGAVDITINNLTLIIPGKPREKLREGVEIHPTIGTMRPIYIKTKNGNEVTLKEIDEINFEAVTEEAPSYLGTKITIKDTKETSKVLSALANQFQKYLTGEKQ
ncbi:MAG: RAMP superfamily CRISPR-associated protein [Candidatus Jordarchaeum sp.]|uniref:RAMP superfamily CRISPR-associated protein n=1 Tax=Candidatus Jordarchaeum sp. TaxID=2823881 RepID=UPI00404AC224